MIAVYHGGALDRNLRSLWATPDADYAAAFAQLHEAPLWMLTLDVEVGNVLDLTGCGLNVDAVVTDLLCTGIQAHAAPEDAQHPQRVVRRIPTDAIRAAGYRVVRVREWIDWGAGERHTESVYIADPTAILDREVLPLPDRNFQFPDDQQQRRGG